MKIINLRLYYPHYQQDKLVEVSEEVFDVLCQSVREMRNYERRKRYHRAFYSLDAYDWTENYALEHSPSPEQLVMLAEERAERDRLAAALREAFAYEGQIYIVFPACKIANAVDRSPMTVKNALTELETVGLIERRRQGFSQPNRIYVKIPDGQDIVLLTDRKLSPNNMSNNNLRISNLSGVSERPPARGRYENVFLTEAEVAELQANLPSIWQEYIERLSEYMASTGKTYKSHAATIHRWAKEDRRKGKGGISDYSCKEGESL